MLTVEIAQALERRLAHDRPARRLDIVERARKMLADWPAAHFNYKQAEIRQMLATLDEAIAELRVGAGVERFDLSFVRVVAGASGEGAVAAARRPHRKRSSRRCWPRGCPTRRPSGCR